MKTIFYHSFLLIMCLGAVNTAFADVDLRYFTADVRGSGIYVSWASDFEQNNMYYTIERSKTGADFQPIGNVDGSGNSTSLLEYAHTDGNPVNGDNFYRLRMTDNQGVETYSDVVLVEGITTNPNGPLLVTFPGLITTYNPFTVKVPRIGDPQITFEIYSLDGRMIHSEEQILEFPTTITLDVPPLEMGIYFLRVYDKKTVVAHQFVITK